MLRRLVAVPVAAVALLAAGCHHAKVTNPIANINSKQPDKVLFDRSMEAMKKGKYDVARITLQTLINTYPDSEYVARAKLAVGDSWYAEGGTTALQQAEIEYRDFETFFPQMAEAAEAQLKIATIHYRQMEKPDRDYTHAKRAEEEYRNLIMQYPDSKLVPDAKQKLREVQEVLAEREYRIGHFYYMRESWAAAIARLQTMVDTYPLYSRADDALMLLGGAYERQIDAMRAARWTETAKGAMIANYKKTAEGYYDKIIQRYPLGGDADKARERLRAMNLPVPEPTPEAIAQNKAEEDSREKLGRLGVAELMLHKRPDIAPAAKVGDPTLVDPEQTSAPQVVQNTAKAIVAAMTEANKTNVEIVKGAPAPNAAPPRSDDQPAAVAGTANPAAAQPAQPSAPRPQVPDNSGIQDLATQPGVVITPTGGATPSSSTPATTSTPAMAAPATPPATSAAPAPPPNQVNDATPPSSSDAVGKPSAPVDSSKESSSSKGKKKKKKDQPQ